MSLVKKLQTGGTIDKEALDNAIVAELGKYNLRSKDERVVRDSLVKLRDYLTNPDGKSFSADPVSNSYTVSGIGSEQFKGSSDDIKSGWLSGKLKIANIEDANSVAAAIYNTALKSIQPTKGITPTSTKEKITFGDLQDYAINKYYGTKDNFNTRFKQAFRTDDERKIETLKIAKQYASDYLTNAEKYKDNFEYGDIENVKAVLSAIGEGKKEDWDKFLTASTRFKWEPEKFLLQPTELEELKSQQTKEAVSDFQKLGLTNEQAITALISKGYKPHTGISFENTPELEQDLQSKGILKFKNDKGTIVLIDPKTGAFYNRNEEVDYFSPLNKPGTNWTQDLDRGLIYSSPKVKQVNWNGLGLLGTGLNPGERYFSYSNDGKQIDRLEILGQDNKRTWAKNIAGKWFRPDTNAEIKLTGFSNMNKSLPTYNIPEEFREYGHDDSADITQTFVNSDKIIVQLGSGSDYDSNEIKKLIPQLNHIATYGATNEEKVEALKKLNTIKQLWKPEVGPTIQPSTVVMHAKGGILKGQAGMTAEQYIRKYAKPVDKKPATTLAPKQGKDIAGTLKGEFKDPIQGGLTTASLIGTGLSFIPGVGIVGGAISTIADAIHDYRDDNKFSGSDWANLGMNLGFTALAGIGLGGLRSLKVAGKAAQEVSKLGKLAKIAESGKAAPVVKEAAETISKLGITHTDDIAKNLNILQEGTEESVKIAEKVLGVKLGEEISEEAVSASLGQAYKKLNQASSIINDLNPQKLNIAEKVSKVTNSKIGDYAVKGLGALQIGSGVASGANIVKTATAEGNSLSDINTDDLKNVVAGAALSRMWLRNRRVGKAIEKFTSKDVTGPETTFKVKGETVSVKEVVTPDEKSFVGKLKDNTIGKAKNIFKSSAKKETIAKESNEQEATALKEKLAKAYNKQNEGTDIKAEDISLEGFKTSVGSSSSNYGKLIDKSSLYKSRDLKDYELAKKAIETGKFKPYSGSRKTTNTVEIETPNIKYRRSTSNKQQDFDMKNIPVTRSSKKVRSVDQKKKVDEYLNERKIRTWSIPFNKAGGILKAQTGLVLGSLDPTSLTYKANNKNYLNWTDAKNTSNIFDKEGAYLPSYLERIKLIDDNWFNANKNELQKRIAASGSNYKLTSKEQLIQGATDSGKGVDWKNKKPGILHDLVLESIPVNAPSIKSADVTDYDVDPSGNNWAEPTEKVTTTPTTSNTKGLLATPKVKKSILDWKRYLPDTTDVANLAMFANTISTNRKAGDSQRKAASEFALLPYVSQKHIRIDSPYTVLGNKQATATRTSASRMASSISDIDKSLGVMLEGENKANTILEKVNAMDVQRIDKLKSAQDEAAFKVNAMNTDILGKNRQTAAKAAQSIHLVNANQDLANNTAVNNLITALNRNIPNRRYNYYQEKLNTLTNDPAIKNATQAYKNILTDEGQAPYKTQWEKLKENTDYKATWEESLPYKNWEKEKSRLQGILTTTQEPLSKTQFLLNQALQAKIYGFKSGGSLSRADRIAIQRDKSESQRRLKETEMAYKAIMHNNEMLQKALIKVFK